MDRLATLTLFVRIIERASFSAAASDLGISRPAATAAIKALEQRLQTRLLQRTTRHLQPTPEGEAYYRRCISILADLEDADRHCLGAVSGVVRVAIGGNLARAVLLPRLPEFLAQHPSLAVHLDESERIVDLVREGFDCAVRGGFLTDSDLVVRRLGVLPEITVASPDYLDRHGRPTSPDDLEGHAMVGYVSSRTGRALPLEFTRAGRVIERYLPARVLVTGADASASAARLGFGLTQSPRYRFAEDLAAGHLVEVLADWPPLPLPISLLYPSHRQLSPRVRVFMDWTIGVLGPMLSTP